LAFPEWGFRPAGLNANGLSAQILDAKKITPGWKPEIRNLQFAIPNSQFAIPLHIRLLDTKQIWKAGRQKRIVSYTFFPPSCLPKSLFFAACQATG